MKIKTLTLNPTSVLIFIRLTGYPRYTITCSYPFYKIQNRHFINSIPWVTKKIEKESPHEIELIKSLLSPRNLLLFITGSRITTLLKYEDRQGASYTQPPRSPTERKHARNYGINGNLPLHSAALHLWEPSHLFRSSLHLFLSLAGRACIDFEPVSESKTKTNFYDYSTQHFFSEGHSDPRGNRFKCRNK